MAVADQCSIIITYLEIPNMHIKWSSSFLGRILPWLTRIQRHSHATLSESVHNNFIQLRLITAILHPTSSRRTPSEENWHSSFLHNSHYSISGEVVPILHRCIFEKEGCLIHRVITYDSITPSLACANTQLSVFSCMLDSPNAVLHESWKGDDCHTTWFSGFGTKDSAP